VITFLVEDPRTNLGWSIEAADWKEAEVYCEDEGLILAGEYRWEEDHEIPLHLLANGNEQ
jgi:hypothetical protein